MTCDDAEKNRLQVDSMTVRMIRAVIDALDDEGPFLTIGIGDQEISLSWGKESRPSISERDDDA